jgi:hypothetical protein
LLVIIAVFLVFLVFPVIAVPASPGLFSSPFNLPSLCLATFAIFAFLLLNYFLMFLHVSSFAHFSFQLPSFRRRTFRLFHPALLCNIAPTLHQPFTADILLISNFNYDKLLFCDCRNHGDDRPTQSALPVKIERRMLTVFNLDPSRNSSNSFSPLLFSSSTA